MASIAWGKRISPGYVVDVAGGGRASGSAYAALRDVMKLQLEVLAV